MERRNLKNKKDAKSSIELKDIEEKLIELCAKSN